MRMISKSVLVVWFFVGMAGPALGQEVKDREFASKTIPALKFVRVPAKGKTFTVGSPKGDPGVLWFVNETEHAVTLSADFYLAVTPVTRGQFAAFVKDTNHKTEPEKNGKGGGWDDAKKDWVADGKHSWRDPGFAQTDEHPVVIVSWVDAVAFCKWLSAKDGKEYVLPTEAQWEFACRAGSRTRFSFGDDREEMAKHGNVADATFRKITGKTWGIKNSDGHAFTAPVGLYQKNAFGLQDMHGNVMQWCSDVYADFTKDPAADPQGPAAKPDSQRVIRGGCWRNDPDHGRSASRYKAVPTVGGVSVGFRLAAPAR
jgi:formylglycine-generating enzyme required for sulfatase activity